MDIPFSNPLFLVPVASGLLFVLAGLIMHNYPPKEINSMYGYRTGSSMKNQQRWDFAQHYAALEMIKLGSLLTLSGFLGFVITPEASVATILGIGLLLVMVAALFIRVENAIKKRFNNP